MPSPAPILRRASAGRRSAGTPVAYPAPAIPPVSRKLRKPRHKKPGPPSPAWLAHASRVFRTKHPTAPAFMFPPALPPPPAVHPASSQQPPAEQSSPRSPPQPSPRRCRPSETNPVQQLNHPESQKGRNPLPNTVDQCYPQSKTRPPNSLMLGVPGIRKAIHVECK